MDARELDKKLSTGEFDSKLYENVWLGTFSFS